MRLASKILSFLAITVIIAHTVVPHTHHSKLADEEHIVQHQQAKTILDYVALGFHFEQQGGELEEFVQDSNDNITFNNSAITLTATLYAVLTIEKQKKTTSYIANNVPLRNKLFTDSFGLRGPPLKS